MLGSTYSVAGIGVGSTKGAAAGEVESAMPGARLGRVLRRRGSLAKPALGADCGIKRRLA